MCGVKKKTRTVLGIVIVFAIFCTAFGFAMERNLRPIVLSTAESRVRAIALDAVNSAIARNLSGVQYDDLIRLSRDSEGRVTSLSADAVGMNRLSTQIALTAQQYIADIGDQSLRISIGSLTGNPLLAGRGPEMLVKVIPVGAVSSEFITEFQSAGINQTRHKVYIRIRAVMRIVIPTGARKVEVTAQAPVAETVIVGQAPQSYVNVESRDDLLNLLPDADLGGE